MTAHGKTDPGKQAALDGLYSQLRTCRNCRLADTRTTVVPGQGNTNARVMLVAQAPGQEEDRRGEMFLGRSGQVLNRLLETAGVRRSQFYMTNLLKCVVPKNGKPREWEIERCAPFLEREIEIVAPEIIVPLGYYATRHLLTEYGVTLPPDRKDYTHIYGVLHYAAGQKLYPLTHPAALLYRPDYEEQAQKAYNALAVLSAPCKWHRVCPMRRHYEAGRLDAHWIELYCHGLWNTCVRYQKEERGEYHPDWMLPDGTEDLSLRM